MTNAISELLYAVQGEKKEEMQIVTGTVTAEEPLKIEIGGAKINQYVINRDISPEYGDRLLCLISDGEIYILCRIGGNGA